ncbi:methyltransferase [Patescibacteria group bacterium]|nr:methyltransferase [Patescibacteria group bacterium]
MLETQLLSKEKAWLLKEKYHGVANDLFEADCERLALGEPLGYVIGYTPFLNTTIFLDSHPLIPRAETEFWVENAIKEIVSNYTAPDSLEDGGDLLRRGLRSGGACGEGLLHPTHLHILDLCAGSGCIGVAILKAVPDSLVEFVEIDTNHHATIEKNIRENSIDIERTKILDGDLFENVNGVYDYIFTNPPYLDPEKKDRAEESVTAHEPALALWGGAHGMMLIEKIITESPHFLKTKGVLYIEHEPEQEDVIAVLAKKYGFSSTTLDDQYGIKRSTRLELA